MNILHGICLASLGLIAATGMVTAGGGPMVDAGLDQSVSVNTTVQLDATGSMHPDGEIESYEWRIETPSGRFLTPACATCAQTSFTPPTPGEYEATVTDAAGNTATDTLYITVKDAGPKIDLTGNPAPETGDRVTYFADVAADGAPLDEIVWRVDGENATIRSLDGLSAESLVSMVFLETDAARVRATVRDEAGRTDSAVLNVEPYANSPSETSTVAGPETAPTEATCNDGEYFSENHAECLEKSGSKAPLEVDLPSTIDLCRGDETQLEPTVEPLTNGRYAGSWSEPMPFEGDEIGHHSITYTATADSGETASASTTINVEDCSTTQQRDEVVVISGTENTVANAGDDDDNLAVIDRPTDSATGRLQHAARGFAATFSDAPRDIVTSGNSYVVEVELSGKKARKIVNQVENTDDNAWTGHGNEIVINEHRVLAEGDILDGIDARGADDVTVVFAVDHSNPQQVAKNATGDVGPPGDNPDTSSKRDSGEHQDYSYGTRQSTNNPNSRVGYITPSSDAGNDSNNQSRASESSNHSSGTGSGDSNVGYTTPESDSTLGSASSSDDSNSESSSDTPDPNNDTGYALPGI